MVIRYYCEKSNLTFSKQLLDWFEKHKRPLPWRSSSDPYVIWLSEVILQQTRVKQGLPYFNAFMERFPDVGSLATASQDEVLKLWQGLGYYSRARNMHTAAQQVLDEFKGEFPSEYDDLIKLKGVGDYTAAAIASISNDEKVAVVDGNVFRVLSRIFGIEVPINSTKGVKKFRAKAKELLPKENTGTHNQAIMEFGALHCLPKNPHCSSCPFAHGCHAFQNDLQQDLPVKIKKNKVKTVYMNYLVFIDKNGKTLIQQRQENAIWKGLFDFPLIESTESIRQSTVEGHEKFINIVRKQPYSLYLYNSRPTKHLLTHRKLLAHFWIVEIDGIDKLNTNASTVTDVSSISDHAFPVLLSNFIDKFFFST